MKKTALRLLLTLILIFAMSQSAFAAGLEITKVIPGDGETGKQITNMAVKFTFSETMDDAAAEANKDKFLITDPEGNQIAYAVVNSEEKYPNELWLILEGTLLSNTEYTVTAKSGIVSANGAVLGQDYVSGFKTRNTKTDQTISMLMMVVFMGVMFGMTRKATQDASTNADADAGKASKEASVDVYKYAKEKGISVDEANRQLNAGKEKREKKLSKAQEKKAEKDAERAAAIAEAEKRIEAEMEAARKALNYRVSGPKSVKAAGGRIPRSVIKRNKERRAAKQKAKK